VPVVSDAVRQAFVRYNWPGNVRELENACERIAQTCTCGTVRIGCTSPNILFKAGGPLEPLAALEPLAHALTATNGASPQVPADRVASPPTTAAPISLDDRLRELESSLISWALKVSHGNKSKAAELLQIKRSTLGDRIARCGLERPHVEAVSRAVTDASLEPVAS
jgi:DNA-binding NtrC family response regulator